MPKVVKYSTTTPSGSLRKGNMAIGPGNYDYGTSFYSAIEPPAGGYTIYLNKGSNGPSIYCPANDTQLINITKQISGTTYASAAQCLNYFATQTDKVVIASKDNINPIVTNGLVLNLNADMVSSYPAINTAWYDVSGGGNNGTLTNGPTFDSNGFITFDGIDDQCPFYAPGLGGTATVEMWTKCISLSGKMFFGWAYYDVWTNGDTIGYNTGNSDIYGMSSALVSSLGIVGNWKHLVFEMRSDVPYTNNKIYVNGVNQTLSQQYSSENTSTRNFNSGNGTICGWLGGGYYMNQQVSSFRVYNRALTQTEILQNYYQAPIVTDGLVFAVDAGNLVSYENGSTLTYSLTGSISGSLINGTGYLNSNGGVWDLDGSDDRIILGYQPTMLTSDITQEAWVNADSMTNWSGIISNMPSWGTGFSLQIGPIQRIAAMVSGEYLTTSWAPQTGVWYHILATHRSSDNLNVLYVNGVQENSLVRSISYSANAVTEIGVFYTGGGLPLDGKIGLVRTYNRALTTAEVQQNFNAQRNRFGI